MSPDRVTLRTSRCDGAVAMLDGLDSHVRPRGPRPDNRHTEELGGGLLGPPVPQEPVDLAQAYAFACGVARLQAPASVAGHRLVWVRNAAFSSCLLPAGDELGSTGFTVAGRHTQCGVVLADDPFVALRHVLLRSVALPSGGVALRVFDLHTGLGFLLPDGSRHRSIFAEGPVAIAVGEYALVALPTGGAAHELPASMPAPVMTMPGAVREQLEALAAAMSPYRVGASRDLRHSHITTMPSPIMVGEPLPPTLGRLAAGGAYAITLLRGDRQATVSLAAEDLARGVLIGRSEKCHSEALRRVAHENTSRTHVLVLREGSTVWAYDVASTHGTWTLGGLPIRRFALPDAGVELVLGRGIGTVVMRWEPVR
ncbi:MAG: uncharacterized protein JWP97_5786 [Labilithrix sp.]|nr:uncharacterized protein [Labilithrix sp.]